MAHNGVESFTASGSESAFDFYCEFCNEEGLHKEAAGHCTDCDEYLCESCVDNHKRNRLSRHHEILDTDIMPKDTPPSDRVRKDITTMCKQHKEDYVKYYCNTHETLTCSRCFVDDHKTCTDIVDIQEKSNSIFDDDEYKDFIQNLKSFQFRLNSTTTKSHELIATSGRCCSEAIESIRQFRDDIVFTLDDIETRLKKEATDIKTKDVEKIEDVVRTCGTLQEQLAEIHFELANLESENRVCQAYIRMKETTADLQEIEKQLQSTEDKNTINLITFIPNTKLTDILRNLEAFGTISVNANDQRNSKIPNTVFQNVCSKAIGQDNNALLYDKTEDNLSLKIGPQPNNVNSALFVHDINVNSTNDKHICYVSGSAVLPDGKVLVVDKNNCKLKLIGAQSMRIVSSLQLPRAPRDVTVIAADQVAVTVPAQNKIIILKVAYSFIQEREIRVKGKCHGIVYSKNQLIVSYCYPAKLEIMDLQGNVSVIIDTDKEGNKLFNRPEYICVSNDGDTIYVSDYGTLFAVGRVISLSRNGNMKAIYTDFDLRGQQKVCTDHRGNVYVCGYQSRNIHMLSADCYKIKIILAHSDGLTKGALSVSHCRQTDRLYVGIHRFAEVKVYQLS